jgi:4-hydroxybenzoate polyprenyltransferase
VIGRYYRILQYLSIDVMLGALASGAMAARLMGQAMPAVWWTALPLSVWVVYTTDHLLDARRMQGQAHSARHLFHHRYYYAIAAAWAGALMICITWAPWQAPQELLLLGMGMGMLVLLHLGIVSWAKGRARWWLQKELGVGLIYSAGVWGGPLALSHGPASPAVWLAAAQFFGLAMINLLVFSVYEEAADTQDGQTSFVRAVGRKFALRLVWLIALLTAAGGWLALRQEPDPGMMRVQAVYAAMLLLLMWIAADQRRFAPQERYRLWGDLVFLFPALAVWIP